MKVSQVLPALLLIALSLPAYGRDKRARVVIDPGHGGQNMGALGAYGVYEKYVTLSIALRLGRLLEQEGGIAVFYTRKSDVFVGLRERADLANALDADIFVSIHCNASPDTEPHGIETYFLGPGGEDPAADEVSRRENATLEDLGEDTDLEGIIGELRRNGSQAGAQRLAETIQDALARAIPDSPDRDVRQGRFTVLEESRVPAVVAEVGFITNPTEGMNLLLAPYQERLAHALYDAIVRYLDNDPADSAGGRGVVQGSP